MVTLEDDEMYEGEEEFKLVLRTTKSNSAFSACIGNQKDTVVKIKNEEDSEVYINCGFYM